MRYALRMMLWAAVLLTAALAGCSQDSPVAPPPADVETCTDKESCADQPDYDQTELDQHRPGFGRMPPDLP